MSQPLTVVTGMPRSGTSLLMQMLAAAGLKLLVQGTRPADRHNPHGYFEDERVLRLGDDAGFLRAHPGAAIKIPVPQIAVLPRDLDIRVIWAVRDCHAVARSQFAFIGAQPGAGEVAAAAARIGEATVLACAALAARGTVPMIEVEHDRLCAAPMEGAAELARFVGAPDRMAAMAACVRRDAAVATERSSPPIG